MYPATNSTSPIIWNVKLPFLVELNLSPKLQIKRQHKQCFSCPMSSVKVLVTKSGKKKTIYITWKTEVKKPFIWPSCNLQCEVFQKLPFIMPDKY